MSGMATKQQSLKIFEKLKTKPANKVREDALSGIADASGEARILC